MLIFDQFESLSKAEAFAFAVSKRYKLWVGVFNHQDESDKIDPFPFELAPPIVLVERVGSQWLENSLAKVVETYTGSFAGT